MGSLPRRHLMLTPQFPWTDLCYDLKFESVRHLIQHDNFPQSLLTFGLTSNEGYAVVNEKEMWKYAIMFYLPAIVEHKKVQFNENPKLLFIELYQQITLVLKENHLSFSDYVAVVLHQNKVPGYQNPILRGLLIGAGHRTIEAATSGQDILDHALVFSAMLGNDYFITKHFQPNRANYNRQRISQALVFSAKADHQRIFQLLLNNANPQFDATTLRSALLGAAEHGHTRIVASLLVPPYSRFVAFTLKKVVQIAISHNYPEMLMLIFLTNQPQRFGSEIRSGVITAAERNIDSIIVKTHQLAPAQFNDYTICKLMTIGAGHGNLAIVNLFVQHPALLQSPATLIDVVKTAMNNQHVDIALLVLQHCRAGFRVYIKRELFMLAVQLGQQSIVEDFLKHDDLKVKSDFFENARLTAEFHQHLTISSLLEGKISSMHIDKENDLRSNVFLDSFTQAFSKLSLSGSEGQYTPAFLSRKALRTSDIIGKQASVDLKGSASTKASVL